MPRPPKAPGERLAIDDVMAHERTLTDEDLRKILEESANGDAARQALRARADSQRRSDRVSTDAAMPVGERSTERERALTDERSREDSALDRERVVADEELDRRHDELALALRRLLMAERDANDLRMRDERATSDARLAMRDEFLAMVCHDLRSLLAAVAMRASLMSREQQRDGGGAAKHHGGDAIQRVVARMNLLIGDLLDVVAMESGRFAVDTQARPLAAVLEEAAHELMPSAKARDVALVLHPSDGACWALVDVHRIQQVLANLIGNAVKFTPAGGHVDLTVTEYAQEVVLEVSDTGPGIPAGKEHEVFERFTQLDPDAHVGLGLGLFICKNIVEAHSGRIWVERREGGGSRFMFSVPATDARPAP
ncbi:MAG: HAMP domain-containing histidine kinase [Deltaproteobacteria bacterium]|nr:HAMP domain-containing histidine kinase [Deltaproteobacteria bacterium]